MSKGGSQKTEVKVPAWLEQAAREGIAQSNRAAQIGYMPYFGPDVAAMNDRQVASMRNTNDAARAFGLDYSRPMAGMPQPQTFRGGVEGYSSGPLFNQARQEWLKRYPQQAQAYRGFYRGF